MEMEQKSLLMEILIKVNTSMGDLKDWVSITGKMEVYIKGSLKMV